MAAIDKTLLFLVVTGIWALLIVYMAISRPAVSQDIYYDTREALHNCAIVGRVQQDYYGAHRLQADIDCGPTWIE